MIFLALIYLAFISLGLPDSVLGTAWPFMHEELGVPIGWAGFISAITSAATIASSLLSHLVIHRYGTGWVMAASVALTAMALLGFSLSPGFGWLLLLAIPLGLGAGAVDAGLNAFVAEHYAARHMNWLHCFWGVGAMLGPIVISLLTSSGHSWRSGYGSIAVLQWGLVALLIFSLPLWRKYERHGSQGVGEDSAEQPRSGLFAPLRVSGATLAMLIFLFYTAMESSVMLWGASYLVQARAIAPEIAAGWVSLFFLGLTLGRALSGFVSMKLSNNGLIRGGSLLVITGWILLMLPLPAIISLLALMLVGLGLAPIFPAMLHETPVNFGKQHTRAAMALQMACAYAGTTIIPPLLGLLFARTSFHLMPPVLLTCAMGLLLASIRLKRPQQAKP